jgi:CBS domain containing-hemolysin-like protein
MESHDFTAFMFLFNILVILFLVLLNGFFVAAEFAIVKVRSIQVDPLVKRDIERARAANHVIHHLDAYLSATQLGITLASLGLGWVGEPFIAALLRPVFRSLGILSNTIITSLSFGIAFGLITFLHIVLGELAPKSLAIRRAKSTALWVAVPLTLFYKAFYPAITALNAAANVILTGIGIEPTSEKERIHSEEEIRTLLAEGDSSSALNSLSRTILLNTFSLRKLKVRNIMVPRNRIVSLYAEKPIEENISIARASDYTRFPLCRETLDQVIGMVHIKELLWLIQTKRFEARLEEIRRDILFIPEFMNLETLLSTFLEKRSHMAIIVDEFGGTLGMVTLEDVLEELVGEIQDEFDQEQPLIRTIKENEYLVEGSIPLHNLEEVLGVQFGEHSDAATLGGFLIDQWQDIPPEGTEWTYGSLKFVVIKVENLRVSQVSVQVLKNAKS